jgi:hypothetical protein
MRIRHLVSENCKGTGAKLPYLAGFTDEASLPLRILTISRGQPVHAPTARPYHTGILCFTAWDFTRFADIPIGPDFAIPAGMRRWHPALSALHSLTRLCRAAIHVGSTHPVAPADPSPARGLEHELTSALLVRCATTISGIARRYVWRASYDSANDDLDPAVLRLAYTRPRWDEQVRLTEAPYGNNLAWHACAPILLA